MEGARSSSLTDIYIPDTVERIGKNVFSDVKPNLEILSPHIVEILSPHIKKMEDEEIFIGSDF